MASTDTVSMPIGTLLKYVWESVPEDERTISLESFSEKLIWGSHIDSNSLTVLLEPYGISLKNIVCVACRNQNIIDTYLKCINCSTIRHSRCFLYEKERICNRQCMISYREVQKISTSL
jgi:hypothetical protein